MGLLNSTLPVICDAKTDEYVFYIFGEGPFSLEDLSRLLKLRSFLEAVHPEVLAEFETFQAVDGRLHES